MIYRYDDALRRHVVGNCASFTRWGRPEESLGLKRAAVTITLLEMNDASGEAAFLLTRRAAKMRAHSGQWALPGGRCDQGETAVGAALRELEEEIGLKLGANDVLGILDDYPTRSGYLITPVVLWAGSDPSLRIDAGEVASIHHIPLRQITRPEAVDFVTIPESDRHVVRIKINDGMIHAPTAAVLYQFREVLAGRMTRVAHLEQPVFAWR
jgi:8-oxo-dGTP pyrophosphatase MutT (NUDIX family)